MRQLSFDFPGRRGRQRIPLERRFWMKVDRNGPIPPHVPELGKCWVWTAARSGPNGTGYGVLSKGGKRRSDLYQAHRLSWELHNGPVPSGNGYHGTCVLHRCDNPACVNPSHLFLGTMADNMQDMRAKGRGGSKAGPCESKWEPPAAPRETKRRLSPAQVREIRSRLDDGESRASVALRFGITTAMVGYIVNGRYWKHVA